MWTTAGALNSRLHQYAVKLYYQGLPYLLDVLNIVVRTNNIPTGGY